tara:strand:- start:19046 stop:19747 length:702 start_codon:yes stop_codon:yes gene_type:complete
VFYSRLFYYHVEFFMSEQATPHFDDFATVFWRLGSMLPPSQLQGYVMGQLAVGAELTEQQWLQQAWQLIDSVEPGSNEDNQLLAELLATTQANFAEGSLNAQLLLPDDDIELSQRVECLGFWCQGFLTGFALAGKQKKQAAGQQAYSSDVSEALSDMAAIAQVSLSADDSSEQSEADFFDVIEYVRLAAMNIYFECLPKQEPVVASAEAGDDDAAAPSTAQLFAKKSTKKQLH